MAKAIGVLNGSAAGGAPLAAGRRCLITAARRAHGGSPGARPSRTGRTAGRVGEVDGGVGVGVEVGVGLGVEVSTSASASNSNFFTTASKSASASASNSAAGDLNSAIRGRTAPDADASARRQTRARDERSGLSPRVWLRRKAEGGEENEERR